MNLWQKYRKLRDEDGLRHPLFILWRLIWLLPLWTFIIISTVLVFFLISLYELSFEAGRDAAIEIWLFY